MHIAVDFKSSKPVYLQVVDQVKAAAASGALRPGEPLPSIRPLAEMLRVNRNTVAKAYAELENQGVIESAPGRGCFLRGGPTPFNKEVCRDWLTRDVDQAVVQAHHLQVTRAEFLRLAGERFDVFQRQRERAAGG